MFVNLNIYVQKNFRLCVIKLFFQRNNKHYNKFILFVSWDNELNSSAFLLRKPIKTSWSPNLYQIVTESYSRKFVRDAIVVVATPNHHF